jgi:hypothetical protein
VIEKLASGGKLTVSDVKALVQEWDEMRRSIRLLRGLIAGGTKHVQADELTVNGDANVIGKISARKVGIGTESPDYLLEIIGNEDNVTQVHIGDIDVDSGMYLTTTFGEDAIVSAGAAFDGTNWVAKDDKASIVARTAGNVYFYGNTGLTPGNTFTLGLLLTLTPTVAIFNNDGADIDFRIETDDEDNFFFINGNDNTLRIGDADTNYTQFAVDGLLTLVGTARVTTQIAIDNANLGKGNTAPTQIIIGNYNSWEYDINDDTVFTFHIPHDWATGTDIAISIDWFIDQAYATNNGEVKWQIVWAATPHDASEPLDGPTHTGTTDTGDINIPATAKTVRENSLTIAGASLSAEDQIGVTVSRIALTAGNNPSGNVDPAILDIHIQYIADKLGEAT